MEALICFFVFCLITITTVFAADPFADSAIREIQHQHDLAVEGDKNVTKELVQKLETLTKAHPENGLYLCYLGSAYTLASRDAFPGPKKLTYLKDGIKFMDEAVAAHPTEPGVRFVRAMNNFMLPAIFQRRDNAREDFKVLVNYIDQNPNELNAETRQAIYYFAGLSFKQLRDLEKAHSAWTKGCSFEQESVLGKKIRVELDKLDHKTSGHTG
jgi:hypothetical protein